MKLSRNILLFLIIAIGLIGLLVFTQVETKGDSMVLSHIDDLRKQELKFYWKDEGGTNFKNFKSLNDWLKSKSDNLVFAMNGGMYKKDLSPQGLYIENGIIKSEMDSVHSGYGNFYMQPNEIFYITNDNLGIVCKKDDFKYENVKYATQSGPMLLIDGKIHSRFRNGYENLNIRNGVGILPNGSLVFGMSKKEINFYDFAMYFKILGCKNALYLDGFVSKTYLPEKGFDLLDGNFGVIIEETKKTE